MPAHLKRRIVKVMFCSLILTLSATAKPIGFKDWLCGLLGIDPKVYSKLSRVRGGETRPGMSLASLDLRSGQEKTLWKCNGCWSPAAIEAGQIAVIKQDGIWLFSADTPDRPELKVPAGELVSILGLISGQPRRVLVVQKVSERDADRDCRFRLRQADLTTGTLQEPAASPQPCVRLAEVVKADRMYGNQVIRESSSGGGKRYILKAQISNDDDRKLVFTALSPDQREDVDRFDPIWLDDKTVAYLTIP